MNHKQESPSAKLIRRGWKLNPHTRRWSKAGRPSGRIIEVGKHGRFDFGYGLREAMVRAGLLYKEAG